LHSIKTDIKEIEEEKYEENDNDKQLKKGNNNFLIRKIYLIIEFANIKYDQTEKSNILNLLNYTSEWLYSPVDEELENKLYFLDCKPTEDLDEENTRKKIKKSATKDDYFKVEDYFRDKLEKKLLEDLNNNKNISLATMKKYGLLMNEKI
jgi:hypothetical protein